MPFLHHLTGHTSIVELDCAGSYRGIDIVNPASAILALLPDDVSSPAHHLNYEPIYEHLKTALWQQLPQ